MLISYLCYTSKGSINLILVIYISLCNISKGNSYITRREFIYYNYSKAISYDSSINYLDYIKDRLARNYRVIYLRSYNYLSIKLGEYFFLPTAREVYYRGYASRNLGLGALRA